MKLPSCSKWGIWEGKEIEGSTNRGELTLFVREGNFEHYLEKYTRVWFCKEYSNWEKIHETVLMDKVVCLEATLKTLPIIPKYVKNNVQIYLKIEADLKQFDHICVGTAFKDEAFIMGSGQKVQPEQYKDDKRLT